MRTRRPATADAEANEGEFLWLISLSDLMILLFVFFVVLFSFAYQKMDAKDFREISSKISGKESISPLDEVQAHLLKWVVDKNLLESVHVNRKEDALILEIKEQALFASGDYKIREKGDEFVSLIRAGLEMVPSPYRIGIEGHTDDVPVRPNPEIHDNWELSVRRAHNVFQALKLNEDLGKRSVIMGFADTRPLKPNRDEKGKPIAENQASNRRVTIRIF